MTANKILPISEIIPESNIVVISPHFDDVLFMIGGYIQSLKDAELLNSKKFSIQLVFSRSNYQAGDGRGNFDTSLDRIKMATGNRIIEDQECLNELIGSFNYGYEMFGEDECFTRSKPFADSEMEFPRGMFDDFDETDNQIFERMKQRVRLWAGQPDTALIFPLAIKEHIDHFIVREAALAIAKELNTKSRATFYFQEDKPYGGLATSEELTRTDAFVDENLLESRFYSYDPEVLIHLAFKHYVSQVEEVYKQGIRHRASFWKKEMKSEYYLDRICVFNQV